MMMTMKKKKNLEKVPLPNHKDNLAFIFLISLPFSASNYHSGVSVLVKSDYMLDSNTHFSWKEDSVRIMLWDEEFTTRLPCHGFDGDSILPVDIQD